MNLLDLPDGKRLCWAEYGDPDGRPVFLFHGNPGSRLACKPRALERWPEDVVALADHLEVEEFAVFGPSGGAPYALACAW
jgi:pimeloyl-ACP methyl ester carboxylesterase